MCCYNASLSVTGKIQAPGEEHLFICEIATARVRSFFRYLPDFYHLIVEVASSFVERPDSFPSVLPVLGKSTSSGAHFQCFLIVLCSFEQTFMTVLAVWLAQFGGCLAVLMAPEMQPTQAASSRFLHMFVCGSLVEVT